MSITGKLFFCVFDIITHLAAILDLQTTKFLALIDISIIKKSPKIWDLQETYLN